MTELDREGRRRLEQAILGLLPPDLRDLVAVAAEPNGRVTAGLKRGRGSSAWRRRPLIDRALRELGAYYVSEDWPGEDHWVISARRALRLAEFAGENLK